MYITYPTHNGSRGTGYYDPNTGLITPGAPKKKIKKNPTRLAPGPYNPMYKVRKNKLIYTAENKYVDYVSNDTSIISADPRVSVQPALTGIYQGTGVSQRIGSQVAVNKFHYRVHLGFQGSNSTSIPYSPGHVRVMLILDKQSNGSLATYTDMFQQTTTSNELFLSYMRVSNSDRFQVLRNHYVTLPPPVAILGTDGKYLSNDVRAFCEGTINFKKPLIVKYAGTSDTHLDIIKNNLYMVICHDATTGGSVYFHRTCRLRFTDL